MPSSRTPLRRSSDAGSSFWVPIWGFWPPSRSALFVIPPTYRAAGKILLTTDRAQVSDQRRSEHRAGAHQRSRRRGDDLPAADPAQPRARRQRLERDEPATGAGCSGACRAVVRAAGAARPRGDGAGNVSSLHGLDDLQGDDPLYWRTRGVLSHLETNNQRPSNIIDVGFASPDPAWAQDFVNRLMRAYVDHHARMQQLTRRRTSSTSRASCCGRSWSRRKRSCRRCASAPAPSPGSRPRCTSA